MIFNNIVSKPGGSEPTVISKAILVGDTYKLYYPSNATLIGFIGWQNGTMAAMWSREKGSDEWTNRAHYYIASMLRIIHNKDHMLFENIDTSYKFDGAIFYA